MDWGRSALYALQGQWSISILGIVYSKDNLMQLTVLVTQVEEMRAPGSVFVV